MLNQEGNTSVILARLLNFPAGSSITVHLAPHSQLTGAYRRTTALPLADSTASAVLARPRPSHQPG